MIGFIKKCFFTGLAFLSILTGVNSFSCISTMNNTYNNIIYEKSRMYSKTTNF